MKLRVFAVLAAVAAARAEIAYPGGLMVKGPLSCAFRENYPPGSLYNQIAPPWPGKYQVRRFASPPAIQTVDLSNPSPLCSCGDIQNIEGPPLIAGPQLLGGPPLTLPVPTAEYATQELSPPPTFSIPSIPPAPDPPRVSPIMKIPRRSDPSSVTITMNSSDSPSTVSPNSVYSSLSPPPSFTFPSRPLFYTRPPPLLASCPATVFYPATISYSLFPPQTCPAQPATTPPTFTPPPTQPAQPVLTTTTTSPTSTLTTPKNDGKTVASFTSTVPETKFNNASAKTEKRDPLLTFKLLSAAAKTKEILTTPPSAIASAPSTDCSMPTPPVLL